MTIEQIRYFLEVARTEHLGKAARALHLSPSALSHSISQLEEELGTPLLLRHGRGIFLSENGRSFAQKSALVFSSFSDLKGNFSATPDFPRQLRFAATHGIGEQWIIPAWNDLRKKFRCTELELLSLRSAEVIEKAITGEIDLGFCFSPLSHPKLNQEILLAGELLIVAKRSHPIFRVSMDRRLAVLGDYVSAVPKAFQGIDNCEKHPVFKKLKIDVKADFIFDSYLLALDYLAQSDAWALVPDFYLRKERRVKSIFRTPLGAPYNISAVWSAGRPVSGALNEFLKRVRKRGAS